MDIHVVSIFPEMYRAIRQNGVIARAFQEGAVSLKIWNPRDYTEDPHRSVDDRPYGGGPGMVMMYPPLSKAIEAVKSEAGSAKVIYMSAQGKPFTQAEAKRFAELDSVILLSGRYEGIDERVVERYVDEECSIGDYVLSGGELASMVWIDAVIRCRPGVLGNKDSVEQDSFFHGLLDYPHYTRPVDIEGRRVPDILLSGDHASIDRWRLKLSLGRTWLRRPELLQNLSLTEEMKDLLEEFKREIENRERR